MSACDSGPDVREGRLIASAVLLRERVVRVSTVKFHSHNALRKLGAGTRGDLLRVLFPAGDEGSPS